MLEGVRDDAVRERWANNREGRDEAAVHEVDNGSTERVTEENEREVKLSSSLSRCRSSCRSSCLFIMTEC